MDLKDLKLKKVMYFMQSFVINAGGKSFEVPRSMIANIDISKNYDTMIYPCGMYVLMYHYGFIHKLQKIQIIFQFR